MLINDLIKGNKKFREVRFSKYETDLKQLSKEGQNPDILFIGCSDSRVTPELVLDTRPGDMLLLEMLEILFHHIILMKIFTEQVLLLNML